MSENIDELAASIENQIQKQKQTLENAPEFDSKYRRMEEADVQDVDLFAT